MKYMVWFRLPNQTSWPGFLALELSPNNQTGKKKKTGLFFKVASQCAVNMGLRLEY